MPPGYWNRSGAPREGVPQGTSASSRYPPAAYTVQGGPLLGATGSEIPLGRPPPHSYSSSGGSGGPQGTFRERGPGAPSAFLQQRQYVHQQLHVEPQLQPQQQQQQQGGEVEALQQQCRESLRSSIRIVGETNQTSQAAAEQLAAQSEQLSRIAETTEEIGQNLETSQYLLKGMKSWWGALSQLFGSPAPTMPRNQQQQRQRTDTPAALALPSAPLRQQQQQQQQQRQQQQQQQQQLLLFGDRRETMRVEADGFEAEIETDLGKLSTMLKELHGRASAMNRELQQQNECLSSINEGMIRNKDSMERQRRDIKDLLKR